MATGIKEMIKVSDLKFDEQNPRIPRSLQGEADEVKIIEYMIKFGNVTELMSSIIETGYSDAEPILVVNNDNDKGKYVVVEGNRRLAALRLLNNPELAKVKVNPIREIVNTIGGIIPTEVPCIIYDARAEILDYLGYRHITGVKEWGAIEKARYLDSLYIKHIDDSDDQDIYKKLARMIGSRTDYVKKLHVAYKLYIIANDNAYFQLNIRDTDMVGKFSWITNSLGYSEIQKYLGLSEDITKMERLNMANFKLFFKWMFDKKDGIVDESRGISKLARVLNSEEAINKLKAGVSLDEAILYTDEPEKMFISFLDDAKKKLLQAKMAIEQLSSLPAEANDLLEEIIKLQRTITGALKENFAESELDYNNISKEELIRLLTEKADKNNDETY